MKILLDECVTKKLKAHLKEFEVFTVTELGWGGGDFVAGNISINPI